MIKKGEVIEVKREKTRGRPFSPLLFIAGAEKPVRKIVKTERDERIRQAYFVEGKSIKRIVREFHQTKQIVRRAIRKGLNSNQSLRAPRFRLQSFYYSKGVL